MPRRWPRDGRHHRVPQAQWPLQLQDRTGQGCPDHREPEDLSYQGRGRHGIHRGMTAGMVIVGAGEAGARAAMAFRGNGYTGSVTLVGAERHAPYERPPMSKELMLAA